MAGSKPNRSGRRGQKSRALALAERLANGDFSYVVLAFAIAGKLAWFLWGAAAGAWVFALVTLALLATNRK